MRLTKKEAEKKYPGVHFEGDCWVGPGAWVEPGARVGPGAWVGPEAVIGTVLHKYYGNIVPYVDITKICIGCECHAIDKWRRNGKRIAKKHHETQWWEKTGKAMLAFLISEANLYDQKFRKGKKDHD